MYVFGFSDITIEFIADWFFFPVCLNFKTYPSCNLLIDYLSDSRRIQQKVDSSAKSQNINKLIFCLHQACVNNKFYSGKKRCCISPYMNTLDSLFSLENTLIGLHLIMCRLIQSSCLNVNPLVSFLCAVQISISRNYINARFPPKHKFAPAVATQCFHYLPKKKIELNC